MMQQRVSDLDLSVEPAYAAPSSSWRPRVLITGFGPFPGMPENVTSQLVSDLAGRARDTFPAFQIRAEILPTEWVGALERLDDLLSEHQPTTVILFGVSERARGFEVETVARNSATLTLDAAGLAPLFPRLDRTGLTQIAAPIPAARIVARLRRLRLPARVSRDAGGYLCNATLYHLLSRSDLQIKTHIAGFVHVPADLHKVGASRRRTSAGDLQLSYDNALVGAQEILSVCLGQPTVKPRAVREISVPAR